MEKAIKGIKRRNTDRMREGGRVITKVICIIRPSDVREIEVTTDNEKMGRIVKN